MRWLALWWLHEPPNFWVRIGAFNLSLAIILGALFGISLRSWLLLAVARNCGAGLRAVRMTKGVAFMTLGGLYASVAWPMLAWDRPARALAVLTTVLPPMVAGIRHAQGRASRLPQAVRILISVFLILVLLATAVVTLLRSGFITLKTDRVTMTLQMTGETRNQTVSLPASGEGRSERALMTHHVVLWLSDGTRGADFWVPGDRVAFEGRAVLFSKRLNSMGFPNLYEFEKIQSHVPGTDLDTESPVFSMLFPHVGSLAVRSWWGSLQARILEWWFRANPGDSLLAIQIVKNRSPDYPLVEADGKPLERRFLLDLTLDGIPTSRGSSPLETR